MNEMPWTGRDGYLAAPTEDWVVDGHVAGTIKTFGHLTVSTSRQERRLSRRLIDCSCRRCTERGTSFPPTSPRCAVKRTLGRAPLTHP